MILGLFVDDCPRTHRPTSISYCKKTECLYFGSSQDVFIVCNHEKADHSVGEQRKEKFEILAYILKEKTNLKPGGE